MPKASKPVPVDYRAKFEQLVTKVNAFVKSATEWVILSKQRWQAQCTAAEALRGELDELFIYQPIGKVWFTLSEKKKYLAKKRALDALEQRKDIVVVPTMMCEGKEKNPVDGTPIDPASRAQRTDIPWYKNSCLAIDMPNNPNYVVHEKSKHYVLPSEDEKAADLRYESNKKTQNGRTLEGEEVQPHIIIYNGTKDGEKVYAPLVNGVIQRMLVGGK